MQPADVLDYWFGDSANLEVDDLKEYFQRWFQGGKEIDKEIKARFGKAVKQAAANELSRWENTTEGSLALIILLDQFTRNVYRGTAKAFSYDIKASRLCQKLIEVGADKEMSWSQRGFCYMPLQHAEDVNMQQQGIEMYLDLVEDTPDELKKVAAGFLLSAREHKTIIDKFGRFPHRNKVLQRQSTDEELIYLATGAKSFGQ